MERKEGRPAEGRKGQQPDKENVKKKRRMVIGNHLNIVSADCTDLLLMTIDEGLRVYERYLVEEVKRMSERKRMSE